MRFLFFIFFLTFILNGCKEFNPEKISCKVDSDCPQKYICDKNYKCIVKCEFSDLICGSNSHCDDTEEKAKCVCDENFIDSNNDGDCNMKCTDEYCSNHGICNDYNNENFTCNCFENYQGDYCNECISSFELIENICISKCENIECNMLECDFDSNKTNPVCKYIDNIGYNGTKIIQGSEKDEGKIIKIDSSGNIFAAGNFNSNNINLNSTQTGQDIKSTQGDMDIFITRINVDETYGGSYIIKGIGNQNIVDMELCGDNDIYLVGVFEGNQTIFNTKENTDFKASNGKKDIFITKLSYNGTDFEYFWTKTIGNVNNDIVSGLAISSNTNNCNLYLSGTVETRLDASLYNNDIFIAKYDSDGNEKWSKITGGNLNEEANDIAINEDNHLYITGYSQHKMTINNNEIEYSLFKSEILKKAFLLIFTEDDLTPSFKKNIMFDDVNNSQGFKIAIDSFKNIWIIGITENIYSLHNSFLAKINYNSDILLQNIGIKNNYMLTTASSEINLLNINIDTTNPDENKVFLMGFFKGEVNFNILSGITNNQTAQNYTIFISELKVKEASETYQWTVKFNQIEEECFDLYINLNSFNNYIYSFGNFCNSIDFNIIEGQTSTDDKTSLGLTDIFLWRYKENQ